MYFKNTFKVGNTVIGVNQPTYFIADIAANHDGDLGRAKELIWMASEAGVNAAKFQHFQAETIVSDKGFRDLGSQQSHQAKWKKSVFEIYQDASLDFSWTSILKKECEKCKIDFFTSPYSLELVDRVDKYVSAYKVGSGDITWIEIIEKMAKKNRPIFLACGASTLEDVLRAVKSCSKYNSEICLMQCNTNYTASLDNFKYIQLNVLKKFKELFPSIILGLSDHTFGHATVLGAVALGARVVEKHFTDDNNRSGPDHKFSMNPKTWREMVNRTRELEYALGNDIKKVENNEKETVILQRRCIRTRNKISRDQKITKENIEFLRPCPIDGIPPYQVEQVIGKETKHDIETGKHLNWNDLI